MKSLAVTLIAVLIAVIWTIVIGKIEDAAIRKDNNKLYITSMILCVLQFIYILLYDSEFTDMQIMMYRQPELERRMDEGKQQQISIWDLGVKKT